MQWRMHGNQSRTDERYRGANGQSLELDATTKRRRFLIVHNVVAGMRRRWLLEQVCHELQANGADLTLVAADSCEADQRIAAEAIASGVYDAVIAAGGDSTVRGVGAGLCGSSLALGIVPIGTGNVLAEEIRFRSGPKRLARNLMYGPAVSVSGGKANGNLFFAMAGAGFDARVLARLDVKWKRRLGKLAYTLPLLLELTHRPGTFKAEIDGEIHDCSWLIVAKASRYGGPFKLTSRQNLAHDGFHAVVINAKNRVTLAGVIMAIALGKVEAHPNVKVIPCRRVYIPHQPGVPTQLDGEAGGATPLEILPAEQPLDIILPLQSWRKH